MRRSHALLGSLNRPFEFDERFVEVVRHLEPPLPNTTNSSCCFAIGRELDERLASPNNHNALAGESAPNKLRKLHLGLVAVDDFRRVGLDSKHVEIGVFGDHLLTTDAAVEIDHQAGVTARALDLEHFAEAEFVVAHADAALERAGVGARRGLEG